tara:strand:- start:69 stop:323 length:255 start_codon:yes stop_codon:yes gene_type:complete
MRRPDDSRPTERDNFRAEASLITHSKQSTQFRGSFAMVLPRSLTLPAFPPPLIFISPSSEARFFRRAHHLPRSTNTQPTDFINN